MDKYYHVIGIDPSLASTGIAYDNEQLAHVTTQKKDGNYRLQPIYDVVYAAAGSGHWGKSPALAVVEDLPRNAMGAGLTGQAQGCVRLALSRANVSMITIAPATVKKFATGSGKADKAQLRDQYLKDTGVLNKNSDEVDAYYMRQYGLAVMDLPAWGRWDPRLEQVKSSMVDEHVNVATLVLGGLVVC